MAASSLLDVCRFTPTLGGTTDWTYSSAVTGYQSPTAAGVVNGAQYSYRAESSDLSQWEIGTGIYNTSTGVLTRATVLKSTNSNAKVTFSAAPQVAIVALAEDLTVTTAAAKSDQQAGTSAALAVTPLHQQDHPSALKVDCAFTGSTGAIQGTAFNVASVTRTGGGIYTVNFTTPFANTNYRVRMDVEAGTTFGTTGLIGFVANGGRSVGSVNIQCVVYGTSGGNADPASVFIECTGTQ